METERSDFDAILPGEISSAAVRTGNEWLIPLPQTKEAIGLATKHRIAVLGVEVFRVDGLITEGYSGYEFQLAGDWGRFVFWNNEAALQYVVEHEFGSGYGYTLTTTSAREFEALKGTMSNNKSVIIKIKRQLTPDAKPSWEEFEIPYKPNMNVTSALMEIAANPVTRDGKKTTPITYDSNCLEEVCGSCAMLINGRAHMACSSLLDHLDHPIKLEPFSKFPVVRDLSVDRSVLFENLKKVKAWVPVDGTYDLGSGPRMAAEDQEKAYPLSRCISCCCCMEACPQFNEDTGFVGAATISQVRLFNTHPTGQALKRERLSALMGDGGIQECGYAQNCVEICPKDIPLTTSIAEVGGQVMKQALGDLLRK